MYAVIESGGKQYRVTEGMICSLEKIDAEEGSTVVFDKILVASDGENVKVGTPYLSSAKIVGKVLNHGKGDKITVFKYTPKKNYRKKKGHRQPYTRVQIEEIKLGESTA